MQLTYLFTGGHGLANSGPTHMPLFGNTGKKDDSNQNNGGFFNFGGGASSNKSSSIFSLF